MNKTIQWKRQVGRAYSFLRRSRAGKRTCAVVLTYHSVGSDRIGVPTSAFRQQMGWLNANAAVIGLEQLVEGQWPESPTGLVCAITFDDGYDSIFQHAFPVLRQFGFTATVFLVTGAVADSKPQPSNDFAGLYPGEWMLTWDRIRDMQTAGISFGSHLVRHKKLTALPAGEAKEELKKSKEMIEDRLQQECVSFCYPWGRHDAKTVEMVKEVGYRNAVVTIHGRFQIGENIDRYRIPRADIRSDYSFDDFAAVVRGDWDFLKYLQKLRRLTD